MSEEEERRMRNEALAREIPVERFDDDYKESSLDRVFVERSTTRQDCI